MALAKGKSRIRCGNPSLHTKTAIHFAEQITSHSPSSKGAKFTVSRSPDDSDPSFIIECDGIGFENQLIDNNG